MHKLLLSHDQNSYLVGAVICHNSCQANFRRVHEILVDEAFTATDGLISQSFVVTFVHPIYVQIAFIWAFTA